MPLTQMRHADNPQSEAELVKEFNTGHMWVPVDDENCIVWNWMYNWGETAPQRKSA